MHIQPAQSFTQIGEGLGFWLDIALVKVVRTQLGERNPWHHGENQTAHVQWRMRAFNHDQHFSIALVKVVRTQLGERNPWHHRENQTAHVQWRIRAFSHDQHFSILLRSGE
ncbi:hypothetical protein AP285_17470 [Limnospira platensis YZ]|nr:hypothetical protein AP285_17470 [Arthrospira platensis YZ]KDR55507.1 hypothetical protein APPUASWS_021965 [Arthrospira platensis str. Paraca]